MQIRTGLFNEKMDAAIELDRILKQHGLPKTHRPNQSVLEAEGASSPKFDSKDESVEKLEKSPSPKHAITNVFYVKNLRRWKGVKTINGKRYATKYCLSKLEAAKVLDEVLEAQGINIDSRPNQFILRSTICKHVKFEVGDRVDARWQNGLEWYPGTVTQALEHGYTILYDDGDSEVTVPADWMRKMSDATLRLDVMKANSELKKTKEALDMAYAQIDDDWDKIALMADECTRLETLLSQEKIDKSEFDSQLSNFVLPRIRGFRKLVRVRRKIET